MRPHLRIPVGLRREKGIRLLRSDKMAAQTVAVRDCRHLGSITGQDLVTHRFLEAKKGFVDLILGLNYIYTYLFPPSELLGTDGTLQPAAARMHAHLSTSGSFLWLCYCSCIARAEVDRGKTPTLRGQQQLAESAGVPTHTFRYQIAVEALFHLAEVR